MQNKLLYMQSGFGWLTNSGVQFTKEHPYQLVDDAEAQSLLQEGRFREAGPKELRAYYEIEIGGSNDSE